MTEMKATDQEGNEVYLTDYEKSIVDQINHYEAVFETVERIETEIGDLIDENRERIDAITARDQKYAEIDQELEEKLPSLIEMIGEDPAKVALKALKAEKIKMINDQPIPAGSHTKLIGMRGDLTRLIGLLDDEINRSTVSKRGTVRGTRIPGKRGSGAWYRNDQITTEPHENGRDTKVLCPFCDKWFANENSAYRHIETKHPGGIEKILSGENLYL